MQGLDTHAADLPPAAEAFTRPFYFLRHGESLYNRARRLQGQSEVALSPLGEQQAEAAAADLATAPIKRIVSSTLGRARRTAEAVAAKHGLPVETDPGLMECHLGIHQGQPYDSWLPDYWAGRFAPEGGEDFWQFRERVWLAMTRVLDGGADTLIVAHGGLWLSARSMVRMEPDLPSMPNALPLYVEPDGEIWRISVLGDRSFPN